MTRTSTLRGARVADRHDLALLQHAQQLGLHRERHLADLVEEDRAAGGGLEQAAVILRRAGERARRWPNSSLSSSVSGSAAQLTATNGASARAEARWMPRATSSLPVPVSPSISTVIGVAAALSIRRNTSRIARLAADDLAEAVAARHVAAQRADLGAQQLLATP